MGVGACSLSHGCFYFSSFNKVSAASFPNSLAARGLAPVINFLSKQTVLSALAIDDSSAQD